MADSPPLANYNTAPVGGIPPPNPTYPVQNGTTQAAGSSGGLVNVAAQIQSGVQNGVNLANQLQQMKRAEANYQEGQRANAAGNQAGALPPPPTQTQTGNGHLDFFHAIANSAPAHALMAGVHAIGHALTGGAIPPQAPASGAAPVQQGPPAPVAAAPQQGPPAPSQALADGGPVTDDSGHEIHKSTWGELAQTAVSELGHAMFGSGAAARAADASRGAVDDAQAKANIESKMRGGPVGGPSHRGGGFGVSDAGIRGIQGFADGGAIPPTPAAAAQAGAQNGADLSGQLVQQGQAAQQYNQGQAANGGMAAAAATPPPEHQLATVVEKLHQDMLDHTLNDNGVPNKDAATPSPQQALNTPAADVQAAQTAQAVQSAQQNPAAQQGDPGPDQSTPHSISHEQWAQWDANIDHAVQLAAQAGRDPSQTRAALEANRNAWVQGHVLRYLSAANAALLNNDDKGVETALRNAYYYIPDGNELKIQHDQNTGRLVYQDPINPTRPVMGPDGKPVLDSNGKPKTEPNIIPVDAAHIQQMGVALLNPLNLNSMILEARGAQAKIALEQSQARAAELTGEGNFWRGRGVYAGGDAKERQVAAENYMHLAEGDKQRALAAWWNTKVNDGATTDGGKVDPTLLRMGQQAGAEYDNIALGRQTVVPTQVPDPKRPGQMMPNQDPNAGKPTRDISQVPEVLKHLAPEQHAANKATAADIAMANGGQISPARAADIVTRIEIQRNSMHPGPDGKPQRDVMLDKAQGLGHVWDKQTGTWINFKLHPNTAQSIKVGAQPDPAEVMAAVASGQGSGGAAAGPSEDPEATAPDMEPPPVQQGG